MELTIKNLEQAGSFVAGYEKCEVVWLQGASEFRADVYVRRLSYHSVVAEIQASESRNDAIAGRISACICDASGAPIFTVDDIVGAGDAEHRGAINHNLTMALLAAISKVNHFVPAEGEALPKA